MSTELVKPDDQKHDDAHHRLVRYRTVMRANHYLRRGGKNYEFLMERVTNHLLTTTEEATALFIAKLVIKNQRERRWAWLWANFTLTIASAARFLADTNPLIRGGTGREPALFFVWDLFSILLPPRVRKDCWRPSFNDLKLEYLQNISLHPSSLRRVGIWLAFLAKSTFYWAECWWLFLPRMFRVGLVTLISLWALIKIAELLGQGVPTIEVLTKLGGM